MKGGSDEGLEEGTVCDGKVGALECSQRTMLEQILERPRREGLGELGGWRRLGGGLQDRVSWGRVDFGQGVGNQINLPC